MKPVSLADISYEQGLQLLVLRKQALDRGTIRRMPKEAMDNAPLRQIGYDVLEKFAEGSWLDSLGSGVSGLASGLGQVGNDVADGAKNLWGQIKNPHARDVLKKGLIGAGVGAGAGLGASMMNGEGHYGRNMLMGGVAGGAIGGGLGIYQNPEIADVIQQRLRDFAKSPEATPPAASSTTPPPVDSSTTPPPVDSSTTPPAEPQTAAAPWNSKTEAADILDMTDEIGQEDRINELRSTKDTIMPEVVAATTGGITAGGTAKGLVNLRNWEQYSPEVLANSIRNNKSTLNKDAIKNIFGQGMTRKALAALPYEELVKRIRTATLLKPTLFGNLPTGGIQSVKDLLKLTGDEAKTLAPAKGSTFKGRAARGSAAMAVAGAGGGLLYNIYKKFKADKANQLRAESVLKDLVLERTRRNGGK
jgi:hypothetical protein